MANLKISGNATANGHDLLELINKSLFMPSTSSAVYSEQSIKFNGYEIRLGTVAPGNSQNIQTITFDDPFPNACTFVIFGRVAAKNVETYPPVLIQNSLTKTNFQVYKQTQTDRGLNFIAIGY